jgi:hypothetical protein
VALNRRESRATSMDVHPLVQEVFAAFDTESLPWCLLRGPVEGGGKGEDVDLLVAQQDKGRVAALLGRLGFVGLKTWGRGSHQFFVAYHLPTDQWIRLDIVSRFSFGPLQTFHAPGAEEALVRRQLQAGIATLHPDDAFWTLLLHCLLDKATFSERHARRLTELVGAAHSDSMLSRQVTALLPEGWNAARLIEGVGRQEWEALMQVGDALASAWTRSSPLQVGSTRLVNQILRRATRLLLLRGRGLTVALLAPDGAGKSSVAAELAHTFHFPVRVIYMGRGTRAATSTSTIVARTLVRRWVRYLQGQIHKWRGRLVLFDRYTHDALLPPARPGHLPRAARRWMLARSLPAPDLVILLDAPAGVLFQRKGEQSLEALERRRRHYLELSARVPGMVVVDAAQDLTSVRREVTQAVWDEYRRRVLRNSGERARLRRTGSQEIL